MNSTEYQGQLHTQNNSLKITYGTVASVNSIENSAVVITETEGVPQRKSMDLPSYCSPSGIGLRFSPFVDTAGSHSIRIYQEAGEFVPMGYTAVNHDIIDNKDNTKQMANTPLRCLNPGEVSLYSGFSSELFMSRSGSVTISDSQFDAIVIDPVMSTINMNAGNVKYELDGVRIRAGNIKRPVNPNSYDEMFLIKEGETQEQEFFVQVGTEVYSDGTESNIPSVGIMGLGTRIADEQGRFYQLKDSDAQFLVKTAGGGGIGISSTGDIFFMDYNSGSTTVFGGGETGDKWIRAGNNSFCTSASTGISLNHSTGSSVELVTDGSINIIEATGNHMILNANGLSINCGQKTITYSAKLHNMMGSLTTAGAVSFGSVASFQVLRAEAFALLCFDIHVHPGPGAPPAVPLSTLLTIPGTITATNFLVS